MRRLRLPDFSRLLRRARPAADGRARLGSRQIYILPTARGWLFAVLLAALLLAGINYSNNLIFALTFLLAGIGHAALLLTWRNLAGLQLAVHPAEPVFAGATARFPAMLESGPAPRDAIRLSFRAQPPTVGDVPDEQPARIDVPILRPFQDFRCRSAAAPPAKHATTGVEARTISPACGSISPAIRSTGSAGRHRPARRISRPRSFTTRCPR